jgi:hypothetical protein
VSGYPVDYDDQHDDWPLWTYPQLPVEQVPMFLDAQEIIDHVERRGDWFSVDYDSDMGYDVKLDEAEYGGLYDSIVEHGVLRPIVMRLVKGDDGYTQVWTGNGHHRTAVAADLGQLVPVIWTRGYDVWADDSYSDPERERPIGAIGADL